MRRDTVKLLVLAGVVVFAVLYGMELSSSGIRSVYGPMETGDQDRAYTRAGQTQGTEEDDWTLPPRRSVRAEVPDAWEADPVIPRNDREPLIDKLSGKTAEALHDISAGGIRIVVSLFDKMTGSE